MYKYMWMEQSGKWDIKWTGPALRAKGKEPRALGILNWLYSKGIMGTGLFKEWISIRSTVVKYWKEKPSIIDRDPQLNDVSTK